MLNEALTRGKPGKAEGVTKKELRMRSILEKASMRRVKGNRKRRRSAFIIWVRRKRLARRRTSERKRYRLGGRLRRRSVQARWGRGRHSVGFIR